MKREIYPHIADFLLVELEQRRLYQAKMTLCPCNRSPSSHNRVTIEMLRPGGVLGSGSGRPKESNCTPGGGGRKSEIIDYY